MKRHMLKALKDLEKIYPLDLLESHSYEKFLNKYEKENLNIIERLKQNGLIENNKQNIIKLTGTIEEVKDENESKLIKHKFDKKRLESIPSSIDIPILSGKGFKYLLLKKQQRTNHILVAIGILTLVFGLIQLFK